MFAAEENRQIGAVGILLQPAPVRTATFGWLDYLIKGLMGVAVGVVVAAIVYWLRLNH